MQFFLGTETILEISDFFTLFKSTAIALEKTAERCETVLHSKNTEYWLVEVPHYRLGQLDQLKEYLLQQGLNIKGSILNRTLPNLEPLTAEELQKLEATNPIIAEVVQDIEHRYTSLLCEQGTIQLPQTLATQLESIEGLWNWSFGISNYDSESSPSNNIPLDR